MNTPNKLTEDMRIALKEYIKLNPTSIFALSNVSGFTPQEVEFIINNASAPFSKLYSLYTALERMLEEQKKEQKKSRGLI